MKAIHNHWKRRDRILQVVPNIKDTNYWKQFTTISYSEQLTVALFRISKILIIESNSQPASQRLWPSNVVPNIKDTNYWKQFTTAGNRLPRETRLFRISKILIIESNSQQNGSLSSFLRQLFRISKILIIESNSQLAEATLEAVVGCSEYQRY